LLRSPIFTKIQDKIEKALSFQYWFTEVGCYVEKVKKKYGKFELESQEGHQILKKIWNLISFIFIFDAVLLLHCCEEGRKEKRKKKEPLQLT